MFLVQNWVKLMFTLFKSIKKRASYDWFCKTVLEEDNNGLRAIFLFFKLFLKLNILSNGIISISHWARGSVGKVLWNEGKVTGSNPCETKTFFYHYFPSFSSQNLTNFIHQSKLIIFRWFFAHLTFKMSILWICQKKY